jgi:hypothetical protein
MLIRKKYNINANCHPFCLSINFQHGTRLQTIMASRRVRSQSIEGYWQSVPEKSRPLPDARPLQS